MTKIEPIDLLKEEVHNAGLAVAKELYDKWNEDQLLTGKKLKEVEAYLYAAYMKGYGDCYQLL